MEIDAIESQLLGRIKKDIIDEGIFYQKDIRQRPTFNDKEIQDITNKNYEVELVKGSGEYFPLKYRQSVDRYREWYCEGSPKAIAGKNYNARLRASIIE